MAITHCNITPIARAQSSVRHRNTRDGFISIGAHLATLKQFRVAAVADMAHKAVRVDMSEFSDMFFPLPTGVSAGDHLAWSENLFDELTEGHVLVEKDIQERFVCFSDCHR